MEYDRRFMFRGGQGSDSAQLHVGRAPGKQTLTGQLPAQLARVPDTTSSGTADERLGDAAVAVQIAQTGSGHPLPEGLRAQFESSLGTELGHVRIHTGGASADAAEAVSARAYATGSDIHFGQGQYDPGSKEGQRLIAHEVAHTVQQGGGSGLQRKGTDEKVDVSQPGDSHEVEADHAADAMLSGRSAKVSPATGIARQLIQRDPLPDTLRNAQSEMTNNMNLAFNFGANRVEDTQGQMRTSTLGQNAQQQGSANDLQRLCEEFDAIRPLYQAWINGNVSATAIAQSAHINPLNPQAYADAVGRLGSELRNMATDNSPRSRAAQQMRQLLQGSSASSIHAATAQLRSSLTKLQNAKRSAEMLRNELEQARLAREVQADQAKLHQIDETIHTIATVITTTATLIAGLTGAMGAASSSLSGAQLGVETFGGATEGQVVTGGGANSISSGAGRVASSGNIIESALHFADFTGQIGTINGHISRLNSQIGNLASINSHLHALNVGGDLAGAQADYERAIHEAENANANFFNAMNQAGRTYDQEGLTAAQAEQRHEALPRAGEQFSMEAILSMHAALQSRGSARSAFGTALAGCSHVRNARSIADRSLVTNISAPMGEYGVLTRLNIDDTNSGTGIQPSFQTRQDAEDLRRTADGIVQIIHSYEQLNDPQAGVENAWREMIGNQTHGTIH